MSINSHSISKSQAIDILESTIELYTIFLSISIIFSSNAILLAHISSLTILMISASLSKLNALSTLVLSIIVGLSHSFLSIMFSCLPIAFCH